MNTNLKHKAAFTAVVVGFFMALLDSTIVTVSLPKMTEYFHTDLKTISWVINAYNIAFSILLITASRLADQFGRKMIFTIGVCFFTLTSYCAGISHTVQMLIFFRILQGMSAALMVPVSMPLLLNMFPPEKSGMVIGVWGAISAVAAASGPALGGIITEYFRWQWIFFINIPLGIITIILTITLIIESFDSTASKKIDWGGIVTLSTGIFALTYALVQANDYGWTSAYIRNLLIMTIVSLCAFSVIELRFSEPMLPMSLLSRIPFSMGMVSLFIAGVALMCGVFFLVFFITLIMGLSQLKAGLITSSIALTAMFFSMISGSLSDRMDSRWFSITGMIITCIAIYLFSQLTELSTIPDVVWRLCVCGMGFGLLLPAIVSASVRSVPEDKIGIGSGVGNMARIIGMVMGVALLVMILTHYAGDLIEEAKVSTEKIVTENQNLKQTTKDAFISRIRSVKFSQYSRLPTEAEIIQGFQKKQDEALAAAKSDLSREIIKTVGKKQIKEIRLLFPRIQAVFKSKLARGFSKTFITMCILVSLGIVLVMFSEPKTGRKRIAKEKITIV